MTVKAIIFDLGNVLVHIHPDRAMGALADRCAQPVERVRQLFLSGIHLQFMAGALTGRQFYQRVRTRLNCPISEQQFREIWALVIGDPKPGMAGLVEKLHERGYDLALCSNTDPWHWDLARQRCPFFQRFSHFFLSFELGLLKPDRRIFEQVLNRLQLAPEQVVFIDDTAENVRAAREVGMRAIQALDAASVVRGLAREGVSVQAE